MRTLNQKRVIQGPLPEKHVDLIISYKINSRRTSEGEGYMFDISDEVFAIKTSDPNDCLFVHINDVIHFEFKNTQTSCK